MTHSEDEEDTRHLFGLPDSAIAVIGVDGDQLGFKCTIEFTHKN